MNKIALYFLLLITPISSTFAYDLYEFVENFDPSQGLIVEKVFGDEAKSIFESTFYREDRDALYDVLYNVEEGQTYTVQAYQYVVKEGEIVCESEHSFSYEIIFKARPFLYYKAKDYGTHALCLPVGKEELVVSESQKFLEFEESVVQYFKKDCETAKKSEIKLTSHRSVKPIQTYPI